MQLVAGTVGVAVHEHPDAPGHAVVDPELAGAEQRHVTQPETGAATAGNSAVRSSVAVKMMLTSWS